MRTCYRKTELLVVGVVLLLAMSFCSCELEHIFSAPPNFLVSKPVCYVQKKDGFYNYAGIDFSFYNRGAVTITEIQVSCMVYENEKSINPFAVSNCILAGFSDTIIANQKKDYSISLDQYLVSVPKSPFLLDNFFVTKVTYADGTIWTDPLGLYEKNQKILITEN